MTHTTIGWDIGGAHLKAVLVNHHGQVLQVLQLSCPLWRGLAVLASAIDEVLTQFNTATVSMHAITMTGELADIFADRHSGVMQIATLINSKLNGEKRYYAGKPDLCEQGSGEQGSGEQGLGEQGFVRFEQVAEYSAAIASANWLASAHYVAQQIPQALLVDMGSTTTDFIVIAHGQTQCRGFTDATRLQFDELVYTGMMRSSLMSLTNIVPFAGEWVSLAAEHFATSADIYRLTAELNPLADMTETADGQAKTILDSARRVARMIGHDVADANIEAWVALAQVFKQAQLTRLKQAALRQYSRLNNAHHPLLEAESPIVGAGVGSALIKQLAMQLNRPFIDASTMINTSPMINSHAVQDKYWASVCFPAYAVASLVCHLTPQSHPEA